MNLSVNPKDMYCRRCCKRTPVPAGEAGRESAPAASGTQLLSLPCARIARSRSCARTRAEAAGDGVVFSSVWSAGSAGGFLASSSRRKPLETIPGRDLAPRRLLSRGIQVQADTARGVRGGEKNGPDCDGRVTRTSGGEAALSCALVAQENRAGVQSKAGEAGSRRSVLAPLAVWRTCDVSLTLAHDVPDADLVEVHAGKELLRVGFLAELKEDPRRAGDAAARGCPGEATGRADSHDRAGDPAPEPCSP
eukprot:164615-Hanusia_phi.AAC.4